MRKWVMLGAILMFVPWIVSLWWMWSAGQAAGAELVTEAGEELASGTGAELGAGAGGALASGIVDRISGGAGEEKAVWTGEMAAAKVGDGEVRRIILEREGIQTYVDVEDYLPGVMVCQVDTEYHLEALKCQAVIARTYIYRLMDGRTEIHEEELDLDYLGGDHGLTARGFAGKTLAEREQLASGLERCQEAAKETAGVVMKYDERYILPLFHGVSAGRTRTGAADYPYLQSVESRWDRERPDYQQRFSWKKTEFAERVSGMMDARPVKAEELPDQIQTVEKDDAGYMKQIKIGAGVYSGEDIQYAFSLPSACYSIEGDGDQIAVLVRGRGHGYGLSQAGADSMASEGWEYGDILQYYYKNISLVTE